jgi:saccharopine dehydrogenase-like NADP-dependent oxidoreductase
MLLAHAKPFTLNNAFSFDVLPNRDCTSFAELYGLVDAPSFFRGTLRYKGFCERMLAVSRIGMLEPSRPDCKSATCLRDWLAQLLGLQPGAPQAEVRAAVQKRLEEGDQEKDGKAFAVLGLEFVGWLGLLSDAPMPQGASTESPIDVLAKLLQREETAYKPGERDMCVMRHELDVERHDGVRERRTATMIEYGEPGGHTAMSRTVGLTAAICAQLVLDGPDRFGVGVQRPLRPEWYNPVLQQLEVEGIQMEESTEELPPPIGDSDASAAANRGAPMVMAKL